MNNNISGKKRKNGPPVFNRKMQVKMIVLFIVIIVALFGLSIRLLYINDTKGEDYTVKVLSQQNYSNKVIPFKRGDIVDRNGVTLATSIKVYNMILDPKVILSDEDYLEPTVEALVTCFGYDGNELRMLIAENSTKSYLVYQKKLSYENIEAFVEMQNDTEKNPCIQGVWFETEYERKYPYSSLACHVLGFTSAGNVGTWGIEEYYDSYLDGVDGREYGYVNSDNIMEQVTKAAEDGNSVVSTIDLNLQTIVEKYIAQWKETYQPENIGAILMNPQNGEIYAMASDITYDLNNPRDISAYYTTDELAAMTDEDQLNAMNKMWRNYCLSDSFEPGSTFKPFTVGAALEEGKITTTQTFVCDGSETIGGHNIGCHKRSGHGTIDAAQAVAYSCNDVLMQIANSMGISLFANYQSRFNFGQKTGIDLPGEASCAGLLYTEENMKPIDLAICSFGQSFNVTMVQLAAGFCSLVNGGYYYQPHVVKEIVNTKGGIIEEVADTPIKQTITPETSDILKNGMIQCVTDGTGKLAAVDGYVIGGKTGTAQKLPREEEKYILSFIGFAGYENTELVCYVVVDNAATDNQASYITTTLFSSIMSEALPYLNIFPDAPTDGTTPDDGTTPSEPQTNPDGTVIDPVTDNPNGAEQGELAMPNIPAGAEEETTANVENEIPAQN